MIIHIQSCEKDSVLPILPLSYEGLGMPHHASEQNLNLRVGTKLFSCKNEALFTVVGRVFLPFNSASLEYNHSVIAPLVRANTTLKAQKMELTPQRENLALAWITLSDKGAAGERVDSSGPTIETIIQENLQLNHSQGFILPDEAYALRALLTELSLGQGYDIICTTGGTGLSPRDITPEATLAVIDKRLPGFEQCMMQTSLSKTPHAVLSRAVVGIIGQSICLNLPGSRKAVDENLRAVVPALKHALDKLHGDTTDCATLRKP